MVLVAVVGGGIILTRSSDQGVGAPVPESLADRGATSSAAVGAVPTAVVGTWMGGPRALNGISASAGTALQITPASLAIAQSAMANKPGLGAKVSSPGDGRLVVTTGDADPSNCDRGVTGQYTYTLTNDGRRLTIVGVADPCAQRLAAIPGDWLLRGCKDPADNCLGDMAAGTYPSQFVTPRHEHDATWMPDYGAVTYTVPDGWANAADWPEYFSLVPSADYAGFGPTGGPDGTFHEIVVRANPAMSDQAADCKGTALDVGRALCPGVHRLDPRPVTAHGLHAHRHHRRRPSGPVRRREGRPDWTRTCPDIKDGTPAAIFMTTAGAKASDESVGMAGDEQMRLVFVDIGQGDIVAIWVDSTDPSRFDQLVADAMPIIESMTFE